MYVGARGPHQSPAPSLESVEFRLLGNRRRSCEMETKQWDEDEGLLELACRGKQMCALV